MEILRDHNLYYKSFSKDYNHLTEDGKQALIEYITIMAPHMIEHETKSLDKRAKELVVNELKS